MEECTFFLMVHVLRTFLDDGLSEQEKMKFPKTTPLISIFFDGASAIHDVDFSYNIDGEKMTVTSWFGSKSYTEKKLDNSLESTFAKNTYCFLSEDLLLLSDKVDKQLIGTMTLIVLPVKQYLVLPFFEKEEKRKRCSIM